MYVFYIWFWKTATGGSQSLNFFFAEILRWTLLPMQRYGNSLSGRGTEHPTFQLRGGNSTHWVSVASIHSSNFFSFSAICKEPYHSSYVPKRGSATTCRFPEYEYVGVGFLAKRVGNEKWTPERCQLPPVALHQVERNGCTESAFCSAQERHEHSTPAALPEKWRALLAMFNITTNGALPCTSTQWLTTRRLNCAQILFPRLPAQNTIARRIQRFLNTSAQKYNNSVAQIARALPPERDDHRHDRATGARAVGRPVAYWRWKCGKQKPELSHG